MHGMGDLDNERAFLHSRRDGTIVVSSDLVEPCRRHGRWGFGSKRVTMKFDHGHSKMILRAIDVDDRT